LAFISSETGKFIWTPVAAMVLAAIGMLTGLMTGLLGVGGGFLIVPLMRAFHPLGRAWHCGNVLVRYHLGG
jgi:uncharacterized membrane protein YfcA